MSFRGITWSMISSVHTTPAASSATEREKVSELTHTDLSLTSTEQSYFCIQQRIPIDARIVYFGG